jgi:uncharacterized protein involved in cysteine biosynthesis
MIKGKIIRYWALGFMVAAPMAAAAVQFPIFVERGSTQTVSAMFVMLAAISAIPFFKQIKAYAKSPASWAVWLAVLVVFIALRSIIEQMIAVAFVGLAANIGGMALYKLGERVEAKGSGEAKEKPPDG